MMREWWTQEKCFRHGLSHAFILPQSEGWRLAQWRETASRAPENIKKICAPQQQQNLDCISMLNNISACFGTPNSLRMRLYLQKTSGTHIKVKTDKPKNGFGPQ
jgi:hypothetical protein